MIVDNQAALGEVIWNPDKDLVVDSGVARLTDFVRAHGVEPGTGYWDLWQWSVDEPSRFWELFADFADVRLGGATGHVLSEEPMPATRWFAGRTVNFARHLLEGREGVALIAVAEGGQTRETSWAELRTQVAGLAAYLRAAGVSSGDRVVGILPNIPEAVVGLLAAASLGAVWSVCAPEFGPGAIVSRFSQLAPKVVIAAPGYRLGGRDRDRRSELAEVLSALPTVERILWVTTHTEVETVATTAAPDNWETAIARPGRLDYVDVEFSHPLWVLFSSGTTGIPKGIVHGHGGALLEELKMLLIHSDLRPGDRYFNVASTSWVLWNSLVSALGVGATAVLVDGNPTYPTADRVWEVAAATETAVLGVSAAFIHACVKADLAPSVDHDLSALRCVQVTGSPLSADGYRWTYAKVGDIWLTSMSGGTDIASIFVGGVPTLPVRVGYIQAPALGVRVESWDEHGRPTKGKGELVVTQPMPSMPLYFWGDNGSRYQSSYFDTYPGVWRHGDFIEFDDAGIIIHGRSDSTLNRNGLRLGSADIYTVVEALPQVAEALVVGAEIGSSGYYMPLFVKLAEGAEAEAAKAAIEASIRTNLSVRYLPDEIIVVRGIPHTRTGKKLEVPVKRLVQGAPLTDVVDLGAVDDAALLESYASFAQRRLGSLEEKIA
ncbi:acetoacetate--CoA ligase [Kocuria sp.]|uniref:acetoacetate--CoA ligase n=1 Tax=Kocuria TaxID=57493 RepID=UPI0025BF7A41|nr:acetoacetate--CoA ligase [Kocuria sp.]